MFSLWSLTAKRVDNMCFLPRSHKLAFAVWQIALAPFTPVILSLCCLGHTSRYINIEICAPVPIRNFISCHQGPTGLKIYEPSLSIHWENSTCLTEKPSCCLGITCYLASCFAILPCRGEKGYCSSLEQVMALEYLGCAPSICHHCVSQTLELDLE